MGTEGGPQDQALDRTNHLSALDTPQAWGDSHFEERDVEDLVINTNVLGSVYLKGNPEDKEAAARALLDVKVTRARGTIDVEITVKASLVEDMDALIHEAIRVGLREVGKGSADEA